MTFLRSGNQMNQWKKHLLATAFALLSTTTHAALESRSNGLVYDTDLNITWLASPPNTLMSWAAAKTWAESLSYSGVTGWRLPAADLCRWWNCRVSELGHLFYSELGGTAYLAITRSHNSSLSLFNTFTTGQNDYWSGTTDTDPNNAVIFAMNDTQLMGPGNAGWQMAIPKTLAGNVMAVHQGDVSAVPEVGSKALFILGAALLIGRLHRSRLNRIRDTSALFVK